MTFTQAVRLSAALATAAIPAARGQGVATPAVWSRVTAPTIQNLNAVAASPTGPYVAVGNAGTILESADGVTWSAEVSGTTQNIYGITATGGINNTPLWIAVGAAGTLLSSSDALTWTVRTSGTTSDLRSVAYSSYLGEYMAVGKAGTAIVSKDGATWNVLALNSAADLNAVVAVPQSFEHFGFFAVAGAGGTVIYDSSLFGVLNISTGTAIDFTALVVAIQPGSSASNPPLGDEALALGKSGVNGSLEITGTDLPSPPVWSLGNPSATADFAAGATTEIDNVSYSAALSTSGLVVPISNAGGPANPSAALPPGVTYSGIALGSVAVVVGQGGAIWTDSSAAGASSPPIPSIAGISAPNVQFVGQTIALSVPLVAGESYQWYFNGAPIIGATNSTFYLSNAQLSASGTYSVAVDSPATAALSSTTLNLKPFADFSPQLVDTGFVASIATNPMLVTPLPNGNVVINGSQLLDPHGNLVAISGFPEADQVIAQPDNKWIAVGEAGPGGAWGITRYNSNGSVDSTFSVAPSLLDYSDRLVLLPHGQFLLFETPIPGQAVVWHRLNSDGSTDTSFAEQSYPVSSPQGIVPSMPDALGQVYIAVNSAPQTTSANAVVIRLNANQTVDSSFSVPASTFAGLSVSQLQPASQGLLYVAIASGPTTRTGLLDTTGAPNLGYASLSISDGSACALQADGTVIALIPSVSATSEFCANLCRYAPTGQLDASYGGRVVGDPSASLNNPPYGASQADFTVLPNGQILVSGNFHSLNLTPTEDLARITPDTDYAATHLVNASVRGTVTPAQALLMAGYVDGSGAPSTGTAPFLFRASGPALSNYGIPNAIADPALTVKSGQTVVGSNAGWSNGGQSTAIAQLEQVTGAFPFAPNSNDAAVTGQIGAGPFYLQITDGSGTGVTLAEAYDAGSPPAGVSDVRVTNFSCLDTTTPGAGQLTLGFVVEGPDVKSYLIRAVGPGLSVVNLTGPSILAAPVLTLYQEQNVIASNQNMNTNLYNEAFADAALVGAFALPLQSPDSALVAALPQGAYTAVASGANATSGTVLLEVYEVP